MKRLLPQLVLILVLLASATAPAAVTVVLKQGVNGYTGASDAYLDEDSPFTNFGNLWYMHLYIRSDDPERSIPLRFDLDGVIPEGSLILNATLSVWLYQLVNMTGGDWVSVGPYRLRDWRNWVETQTTWNYIYTGTYWASPGCENTSWDRYANLDSRLYFYNTSPVNSYYHWNVTPSVQAWFTGAQNHGWLLRCEAHDGGNDGMSFNAKESGSAAYRPYLTIDYEPPVGAERASWSDIKALFR